MWILDLLQNFSGIGTELGAVNLIILAALGFLIRREYRRFTGKVAPIGSRDVGELIKEHDEMYDDYKYRKRRNSTSPKHAMPDKELLAGMVAEILKKGER